MTDLHFSDAGHPGTLSETSSDTIEMSTLEDHEHNQQKNKGFDDDYREAAEGSDDEDSDDRALLHSRGRPSREGQSRSVAEPEVHTWRQVLRIMTQVCLSISLGHTFTWS
jgi:hypothetical protein